MEIRIKQGSVKVEIDDEADLIRITVDDPLAVDRYEEPPHFCISNNDIEIIMPTLVAENLFGKGLGQAVKGNEPTYAPEP